MAMKHGLIRAHKSYADANPLRENPQNRDPFVVRWLNVQPSSSTRQGPSLDTLVNKSSMRSEIYSFGLSGM